MAWLVSGGKSFNPLEDLTVVMGEKVEIFTSLRM